SLGAIWSSCAPEFGTEAVLGRLRQIDPKVLFAVDGYRFGEVAVERAAEVAEIRRQLPSVETVVAVPYLFPGETRLPDSVPWDGFLAAPGAEPVYDRLPFDHPLHVVFSSGTTGLPKPMVHGAGGVLVDHLKTHAFHLDVGPGDRMFFFCTTGWIAWNWLISALAVGSGIVLFDGNPMHPDASSVWQLAAETATTFYASSPGLMMAARRDGIVPRQVADLSRLRCVVTSGAPMGAEGFRWIYEAVGDDVYLQSLSGGTEVVGAFVGGVPLLPCRAGLIATKWLGCAVEAWDSDGKAVVGEQGELVLTEPLPSMPLRLWGDDDGSRLHSAYFDRYPGVWCHGDWITFTPEGSSVITGRSDATLNRGGVRLGTSEFYTIVEALPEVADSLVVHIEDPGGGIGELMLFVVPAAGAALDDGLQGRIRAELRRRLSPRHVPDVIEAVAAIPQTLTGKKLEIPVKRILTGTPPDRAASRGSLANPDALDVFEQLAKRRLAHQEVSA
ncbi:MAG TPA: acetoacetate--CoA ligase, partial [Acidimicrobiia bacterium]